ncbi:MAG: carbohydrate binding domain-containing protein [Myxococcales bacterium]
MIRAALLKPITLGGPLSWLALARQLSELGARFVVGHAFEGPLRLAASPAASTCASHEARQAPLCRVGAPLVTLREGMRSYLALLLCAATSCVSGEASTGSTGAPATATGGASSGAGSSSGRGGGSSGGGATSGSSSGGSRTSTGGPIVTHPTNILVNGGFETGLECYADWVWSTTGKDYKGDYDFYLSSNARSGSYALEIRCNGTDCGNGGPNGGKAAIYTAPIPTPPGQAYTLTVYTQCAAANGSGFVYVPSTASGDVTRNVTCDGSWQPTTVNFTTAANATNFTFYVYSNDTASLFVDDATLTYADGSVPAQTVKHAGQRETAVSGNHLVVEGLPYLARGFYSVPYDQLATVADAGANTVIDMGSPGDCFNSAQEGFLDRAYELGLAVLPDSTFTARLQTAAVFPAVAAQFAPHLAEIGWYLCDEPDQNAVTFYDIPAATFVAEGQALGPAVGMPVTADFQHADWDTSGFDDPYAAGVSFYMAEPYGTNFAGVTTAMKTLAGMGPKPVWLAQDDPGAAYIVPKAWFDVIAGATGIVFFDWPAFQKDAAGLAAAEQAFAELSSLEQAIFGSDATAGYTGPSAVAFSVRSAGGHSWLFAVNPTSATVSGPFQGPALAGASQITVLFENRSVSVSGGGFSDTFSGVARHVYQLQ